MTTAFDSRAWKLYEKLPRPALRYVALVGALWALGGCDVAGFPMESTARVANLGFATLVYGLRGAEKLKEMGVL